MNWTDLLEVPEDSPVLSICGSYGSGGGQCDGHIAPRTSGQRQLLQLWEEYHLNDVCAGTKRQTEYLRSEGKVKIESLKNALIDVGYEEYISGMIENNLSEMPDYRAYTKLRSMAKGTGIKVERSNGKYDYFRVGDEKNIKDRWVAGLKDQWLKDNYRRLSAFDGMKIADVRKFAEKYDDYTGKYRDSSCYELQKIALTAAGLYADRGYLYGHGWLMKALPPTIERDIEELCLLLEQEEAERVAALAEDEESVEDFEMTTDDSREEDENHIAIIMEELDIDEDEAIRFVALAKVIDESFLSLKEGWEVEDENEQRYSFGGTEYYIGTEDELTDVAKDMIDNDPEYEYFWKEAVAAGRTTDGLEDWKESIVDVDGFAHTLDRWDGHGTGVWVLNQGITVCQG